MCHPYIIYLSLSQGLILQGPLDLRSVHPVEDAESLSITNGQQVEVHIASFSQSLQHSQNSTSLMLLQTPPGPEKLLHTIELSCINPPMPVVYWLPHALASIKLPSSNTQGERAWKGQRLIQDLTFSITSIQLPSSISAVIPENRSETISHRITRFLIRRARPLVPPFACYQSIVYSSPQVPDCCYKRESLKKVPLLQLKPKLPSQDES